ARAGDDPGETDIRALANQSRLEILVEPDADHADHCHAQCRIEGRFTVDDRQQDDQRVPENAIAELADRGENVPDRWLAAATVEAQAPCMLDRIHAPEQLCRTYAVHDVAPCAVLFVWQAATR